MTTTSRNADILIRDATGSTLAVVEVKNIQNLSGDEAMQLRHNLAEFGVPFQAPFYLLLSQDTGFLWKDSSYENLDVPPMYEFPMDDVVARYSHGKAGERLYGAVFEILVLRWLNNLTSQPSVTDKEPEKTLALSGFLHAVQGADVLLEAE
jgi:hypothetical protein